MKGRVLIVAGSDSSGGAGIQADIKTVTALNGYAATVVTALTAQNTNGVEDIHDVPASFVKKQMRVTLEDIGADCIKTGMLHSKSVIDAVCDVIDDMAEHVPVVVDPVMVAKGGATLLEPSAAQALKARLILRATVLTPNIPEAEVLTGRTISTVDDMRRAAEMLMTLGAKAVLVKGGHLDDDLITDVLVHDGSERLFEGSRIDTRHTHGTGCTLASAIAAGLAQNIELETAVERARDYVRKAIESAPGIGSGHGPLNHAHTVTEI